MDGALPVDVADLQRLVRELDARVQDCDLRVSAHESVIAEQRDQLRHAQQKIDWLLRKLFARASEKLDPAQLQIDFGEAMAAVKAAEEPPEAKTDTAAPDDEAETLPAKKRTPHGRKPLPTTVERRRVEVPPETTTCETCAKEFVRISVERSSHLITTTGFIDRHGICGRCGEVAPRAPRCRPRLGLQSVGRAVRCRRRPCSTTSARRAAER